MTHWCDITWNRENLADLSLFSFSSQVLEILNLPTPSRAMCGTSSVVFDYIFALVFIYWETTVFFNKSFYNQMVNEASKIVRRVFCSEINVITAFGLSPRKAVHTHFVKTCDWRELQTRFFAASTIIIVNSCRPCTGYVWQQRRWALMPMCRTYVSIAKVSVLIAHLLRTPSSLTELSKLSLAMTGGWQDRFPIRWPVLQPITMVMWSGSLSNCSLYSKFGLALP